MKCQIMSNPVSWEKYENYSKMSYAENFTQSAMRYIRKLIYIKLTLKAPSQICTRRHSFFFRENKSDISCESSANS